MGGAGTGPGEFRTDGTRTGPGDFETRPVDAARGPQAPAPGATAEDLQRFVGEWFNPDATSARGERPGPVGAGGAGDAPSRARVAENLRRAASNAERAVEERTFPARYDGLLRRYFRRLPQRVVPDAAGPEPAAAPVAPAKDAP